MKWVVVLFALYCATAMCCTAGYAQQSVSRHEPSLTLSLDHTNKARALARAFADVHVPYHVEKEVEGYLLTQSCTVHVRNCPLSVFIHNILPADPTGYRPYHLVRRRDGSYRISRSTFTLKLNQVSPEQALERLFERAGYNVILRADLLGNTPISLSASQLDLYRGFQKVVSKIHPVTPLHIAWYGDVCAVHWTVPRTLDLGESTLSLLVKKAKIEDTLDAACSAYGMKLTVRERLVGQVDMTVDDVPFYSLLAGLISRSSSKADYTSGDHLITIPPSYPANVDRWVDDFDPSLLPPPIPETKIHKTVKGKSTSPSQGSDRADAISVLDYLKSISGKFTVAGIHNREPNSRPAQQTDRMFALVGHYSGLWSGDFLFSADDVNNRWTMIHECKKQWDQGAIVQLMLHVAPPNQPEVCQWEGGVKSHLSDAQWKDLLTEGGTLNRAWKSRLDEYAKYLQYLKENGVQVLFRPHHEMNQGAFWWGGRKGPEGTVKLYRLTHDYLVGVKGLTNLIWVWDMQDMSRDFAEYNPGDGYWDIFAFDVYSDGYKQSWYDYILPIVGNKPIAIGECDKLPTAHLLSTQPRWCFFMSWAELTFNKNTPEQIRDLYTAPNVLTRDRLPKFK